MVKLDTHNKLIIHGGGQSCQIHSVVKTKFVWGDRLEIKFLARQLVLPLTTACASTEIGFCGGWGGEGEGWGRERTERGELPFSEPIGLGS